MARARLVPLEVGLGPRRGPRRNAAARGAFVAAPAGDGQVDGDLFLGPSASPSGPSRRQRRGDGVNRSRVRRTTPSSPRYPRTTRSGRHLGRQVLAAGLPLHAAHLEDVGEVGAEAKVHDVADRASSPWFFDSAAAGGRPFARGTP